MAGDERSGRIALCGVQGCCPVVEFTSEGVVITDDTGGKVVLTRKQARELRRVLPESDLPSEDHGM